MSELATGDEVEVFGQRGHVNRIEAIGEQVIRIEVQENREWGDGFAKPRWQGWFVPELLTKIEPPPPLPKIGEVWEHVDGKGRLFFYDGPEDLWCIAPNGDACAWKYVQDKHFYSKVETSG